MLNWHVVGVGVGWLDIHWRDATSYKSTVRSNYFVACQFVSVEQCI
jgi:hypothetical protein